MGIFSGKYKHLKSKDFKSTNIKDYFDPDPSRFEILQHYEENGHTMILIKYPNCINYEGQKVILYKDTTFDKINSLKILDPHFTNTNRIKPFARFEPTEDGIQACYNLMKIL